jgi:DNA-binding transcriptional ArsR family regulator
MPLSEEPVEITDPRALRALAHPARIKILTHLITEGPATATECAEVAGLSPSACSYHLRALQRFGFVAEEPSGAADRRHRPWRAQMLALSFGRDPDRPASLRAAERVLYDSVQIEIEQSRSEYLDREADYPQEWQNAVGTTIDVMHLTAAELADVRRRMQDLLSEYRRLDPGDRPEGARTVGAMLDFIPWSPRTVSQEPPVGGLAGRAACEP